MQFERDGDLLRARHVVRAEFHGAPGVAHGGVVATMLDEVSCALLFTIRGHYVVTGELSVRYERPCPVEQPLELVARVAGERPKYLIVEAEVRDGETVLARSTGKFFPQNRSESAP